MEIDFNFARYTQRFFEVIYSLWKLFISSLVFKFAGHTVFLRWDSASGFDRAVLGNQKSWVRGAFFRFDYIALLAWCACLVNHRSFAFGCLRLSFWYGWSHYEIHATALCAGFGHVIPALMDHCFSTQRTDTNHDWIPIDIRGLERFYFSYL